MKSKKYIAILLTACIFSLPQKAHANAAWGTLNIVGDMYKQILEETSREIHEAIASTARMVAIKQATSTIETLLYGGNSSPRNIKNFEKFLIKDPAEEAIAYTENFLTSSLRGTTSGDYTSTSGSAANDLKKSIESAGESVIRSAEGKNQAVVDLSECVGDHYFAGGDFKCFSQIMSNPLNTPVGMAIATDQVMRTAYAKEMAVAELRATSSGSLDQQDENGNTVLPKALVEEMQLQQITLPLQALANGNTTVFSSAIQAFAVTLITGIVERGLGEVEQSIDENMNAFRRQYAEEMGGFYEQIGPAAEYANDTYDYMQKQKARENHVNYSEVGGNGEYGR